MEGFFNKIESFIDSIPDLVIGLVLLIFAVLVGLIVAGIVTHILKKTALGRKLDQIEEKTGKASGSGARAISIIGKLVFLLVFLLFLPAALSKLGISGVTQPITDLTGNFIDFIPNIVGSVIVLVIGFFVAGIVYQLLAAILTGEKLLNLQARLGGGVNLAAIISTVAYIFIAVPVVIAALAILNIEAISAPAIAMLSTMLSAVPRIILAALILFVGIFLAQLVASFLAALLASLELDSKLNGWLNAGASKELKPIPFTKIALGVVKGLIIVLFAVEALNALDFSVMTMVGTAIIAFLPSVLVAIVFAVGAFILCRLIDTKFPIKSAVAKRALKIAAITIASFIVLSQLNIAPMIVNTAFIVITASSGVAFALAVGLGARQFVQENLAQVKICKCKKENKEDEKAE